MPNPTLQDLVETWFYDSPGVEFWTLDHYGPWPRAIQFVARAPHVQKGYILIYPDKIQCEQFGIYGGGRVVFSIADTADPNFFDKLNVILKEMLI